MQGRETSSNPADYQFLISKQSSSEPEKKPSVDETLPFITIGNSKYLRIDPAKIVIERELGRGNFGTVSLATWQGTFVAVKELILTTEKDKSKLTQEFYQEIKLLAELSHPRVICFYGVVELNNGARIVMEYCPRGTLRHFLDSHYNNLAYTQKITFSRDITLGLSYLHEAGILHIDLAADNILLDQQERPKLADFGLAAKKIQGIVDLSNHTLNIRAAWGAPELFIIGPNAISEATDIYALGVVFFEIFTGNRPFAALAKNTTKILDYLTQNRREEIDTIPSTLANNTQNIIRECWQNDPKKRPSAKNIFSYLGKQSVENQALFANSSRALSTLEMELRQTNLNYSQEWQKRMNLNIPYILPQIASGIGVTNTDSADTVLQDFLNSEKKVWLVLGEAGSGKSLFLAKIVEQLQSSPWIPVLIHLSTLVNPEQQLLETVLQQQGLTTDEIITLQHSSLHLVILLDGYDEINSQENLFITNELFNWPQLKVILSCRPQKVYGSQGIGKESFYPSNAKGDLIENKFTQGLLQSFNDQQIENYLTTYLSERNTDHSQKPCDKDAMLLTFRELPGLQEIIRNPLLLFLTIKSLPSLEANFLNPITRSRIYRAFLENWFKHQYSQLNARNATPLMTLSAENFCEEALEFAESLAITMYQQKKTTISYQTTKTLFGESKNEIEEARIWGRYFDNRYHPKLPILRAACPLILINEQQWSFLHHSIWEHLVAEYFIKTLEQLTLPLTIEAILNLLFNQHSINAHPGIIAFMTEYVDVARNQEKFFAMITASRTMPQIATAAANAITLLNAGGVSLSSLDLNNIQIPYADLSGAVLTHTDLSQANLKGVNLTNACLDKAKLHGAILDDLTLGQAAPTKNKGYEPAFYVAPSGKYRIYRKEEKKFIISRGIFEERLSIMVNFSDVTLLIVNDQYTRAAYSTETSSTIYINSLSSKNNFELKGLGKKVNIDNLLFSPNNELLASTSWEGSLMLWSLVNKKPILNHSVYPHHIQSLLFFPNSKGLITTQEYDKNISVWDISSQTKQATCHHLVGHQLAVTAVTIDQQSMFLASGSHDRIIKLWSLRDYMNIRSYIGHQQAINQIAFSSDKIYLVSASQDNTVRVWLTDKGNCIRVIHINHQKVSYLKFSKNAQWLAAYNEEIIYQWNTVETSTQSQLNATQVNYNIENFVLSPGKATWFALTHFNQSGITLWSLDNFKQYSIRTSRITTMYFSLNEHYLAAADENKIIYLLDLTIGKTLKLNSDFSHIITALAISPDNSFLAAASNTGKVHLWSLASGEKLAISIMHPERINQLLFFPDSLHLVSAGQNKNIKIWSIAKQAHIQNLIGHQREIVQILVREQLLISVSLDNQIYIWALPSGKKLRTLKMPYASERPLAINTHDEIAYWNEDREITIWSSKKQANVAYLRKYTKNIHHMVFEPRGLWLLTAHQDNIIRIWSLSTTKLSYEFHSKHQQLNKIYFGAEGRFLITKGLDGIHIWDWRTSQADNNRIQLHKPRLRKRLSYPQLSALSLTGQNYQGISGNNFKLLKHYGAILEKPANLPSRSLWFWESRKTIEKDYQKPYEAPIEDTASTINLAHNQKK